MKLKKLFLLPIVSLALLASCGKKEAKITNCYLNDEGKVVIVYDNDTTQELGTIAETIYKGVDKIEITSDGFYKINGFKSTIKVEHSSVTISDDGFYIIDGVKTNIQATAVYTVDFVTNSTSVSPQKVKDGYKVIRPEITRKGYTLTGWSCNGEEWLFNSNVVKNDMTLTANWSANSYTVSFSDEFSSYSDMTVTYDSEVTLPAPAKAGYTFSGWYNGNNKVSNGKWTIDSNVTLTSKWTANKYVATLDPNGGTVSKTKVDVTYGENFTLPVPTNSFGAFKGWYLDDVKITDETGHSLAPWNYADSKTLSTNWIEQISTVEQLRAISDAPNGYYELVNDIDLSDIEWTPLCNSGTGDADTTGFLGVLDGKGYKIKNLTVTSNILKYQGLFRVIGGHAVVKNLIFDNVDINVNAENKDFCAGALAGVALGSPQISNVVVNGSISVTGISSKSIYVAGVVGESMLSEAYFTDVINNARVSSPNFAGGITTCGLVYISYFEKCSNTGSIYGRVASGISDCGVCYKCLNEGQIVGTDLAAGISALLFLAEECANKGYIAANETNGYSAGIGLLTSTEISQSLIITSYYVDCLDGVNDSIFIAKNCYNIGAVSGYYCGGIISGDGGLMYLKAKKCYNCGEIRGTSYSGGIAPITCNITDCVNFGEIKTGTIKTAICAQLTTTRKTLNCYYYGSIYNTEYCVATETTDKYTSDMYSNKLGWDIYSATHTSGIWKLQSEDYPKLAWEK